MGAPACSRSTDETCPESKRGASAVKNMARNARDAESRGPVQNAQCECWPPCFTGAPSSPRAAHSEPPSSPLDQPKDEKVVAHPWLGVTKGSEASASQTPSTAASAVRSLVKCAHDEAMTS